MTFTSFATPAELASFLQVPRIDTATAQLLLDMASMSIRAEVGQQVNQSVTTEDYDGPADPIFFGSTAYGSYSTLRQLAVKSSDWWVQLREFKVNAITSVVEHRIDGDVTLVDGVDFRWNYMGVLRKLTGPWEAVERAITVTYDHGWATNTIEWGVAHQVCLQAASRAFVNPQQVQSMMVGSYQIAFPPARSFPEAASGSVELRLFEKAALDVLRPRISRGTSGLRG